MPNHSPPRPLPPRSGTEASLLTILLATWLGIGTFLTTVASAAPQPWTAAVTNGVFTAEYALPSGAAAADYDAGAAACQGLGPEVYPAMPNSLAALAAIDSLLPSATSTWLGAPKGSGGTNVFTWTDPRGRLHGQQVNVNNVTAGPTFVFTQAFAPFNNGAAALVYNKGGTFSGLVRGSNNLVMVCERSPCQSSDCGGLAAAGYWASSASSCTCAGAATTATTTTATATTATASTTVATTGAATTATTATTAETATATTDSASSVPTTAGTTSLDTTSTSASFTSAVTSTATATTSSSQPPTTTTTTTTISTPPTTITTAAPSAVLSTTAVPNTTILVPLPPTTVPPEALPVKGQEQAVATIGAVGVASAPVSGADALSSIQLLAIFSVMQCGVPGAGDSGSMAAYLTPVDVGGRLGKVGGQLILLSAILAVYTTGAAIAARVVGWDHCRRALRHPRLLPLLAVLFYPGFTFEGAQLAYGYTDTSPAERTAGVATLAAAMVLLGAYHYLAHRKHPGAAPSHPYSPAARAAVPAALRWALAAHSYWPDETLLSSRCVFTSLRPERARLAVGHALTRILLVSLVCAINPLGPGWCDGILLTAAVVCLLHACFITATLCYRVPAINFTQALQSVAVGLIALSKGVPSAPAAMPSYCALLLVAASLANVVLSVAAFAIERFVMMPVEGALVGDHREGDKDPIHAHVDGVSVTSHCKPPPLSPRAHCYATPVTRPLPHEGSLFDVDRESRDGHSSSGHFLSLSALAGFAADDHHDDALADGGGASVVRTFSLSTSAQSCGLQRAERADDGPEPRATGACSGIVSTDEFP